MAITPITTPSKTLSLESVTSSSPYLHQAALVTASRKADRLVVHRYQPPEHSHIAHTLAAVDWTRAGYRLSTRNQRRSSEGTPNRETRTRGFAYRFRARDSLARKP